MFSNPGPDPTGPCRLVLNVRGTGLTGKPFDQAVSLDGIRLAQPATYVVTNTSDWLSKLRFTLIEQRGTCTGYSASLVVESFRVGLIDNDGSGFPPGHHHLPSREERACRPMQQNFERSD
jgi:hypothetical protein